MTTVDRGRLFYNQGGGKFVDVTAPSGIRSRDFCVSAAWLEYGRDDLLIGKLRQLVTDG
jgi:hypothetical protein